MQTKVVKIDPFQIDENEMKEAAELIRKGELVAFPTETVYGLGADALHPEASKKIYAAKGRPSDNPLIVHICKFEELVSIAKEVPAQAEKLADAFWPGPLTMIVWKNEKVPYETTGGMETVAIRMPKHPVALKLIEEAIKELQFVADNRANYITAGRICLELGDKAKAHSYAKKVIELTPVDNLKSKVDRLPYIYQYLGDAYIILGE